MTPARFARFRRSRNDTADTALDAIGTPCSDRYSVTSFLTKVQPEIKGALPAAKYPFQISKTPQYLALFLPPNFSGCQPFSQFDSQIQPIRKIRTFLGSFAKKIPSVFSEIKRRFSLAFPADNSLLQQHSQSVFDGGFSYRRHAFHNVVLRELPYHITDGNLHQIRGRVFAFDSHHSFFEIPVSRQHCSERVFDEGSISFSPMSQFTSLFASAS